MWDETTIRAWMAARSPDEIRTCVRRRLRNEDRTPVLSSRFEQAPEQLVQALLEHEGDLPADIYQAVIGGCTDVFESIGALLRRRRRGESVELCEFDPLFRLARALASATPARLRGEAMELFSQVVAQDGVPDNVADAACRMVVAYRQQPGEGMLWVQALDRRAIAGLACRRLIDIDPVGHEAIKALQGLWRRRLVDDWRVNCHLLTKLWLDRQGAARKQCVRQLFQPLMHQPTIRASLLRDLPTSPWGKEWHESLIRAQQQRPQSAGAIPRIEHPPTPNLRSPLLPDIPRRQRKTVCGGSSGMAIAGITVGPDEEIDRFYRELTDPFNRRMLRPVPFIPETNRGAASAARLAS